MKSWLDVADVADGKDVVGIDEAGRGCLAGPVYAAAVWAAPGLAGVAVRDSKTLSKAQRERLLEEIRRHSLFAVGMASAAEIDAVNIRNAAELAMLRAFRQLRRKAARAVPVRLLVDGNHAPDFGVPCETVIKGDARCLSVAAASIVAKTARDRHMALLDGAFPAYGWGRNAGYGTAAHKEALRREGVTSFHRKTYKPVAEALSAAEENIHAA
jgi:ribonuclease HII